MANNLEFVLKIKDLLTPAMQSAGNLSEKEATKIMNQMKKIEGSAEEAHKGVSKLQSGLGSLLSVAAPIGITAGIAAFVYQGIEAVHLLNESEAALKNTLQNMGNYTDEGYEKIIKNSVALSSGIKYSRSDIIDLQSQLRLVGNIGETEMGRMVKDSADLATKMHISLDEAGASLAKASGCVLRFLQ